MVRRALLVGALVVLVVLAVEGGLLLLRPHTSGDPAPTPRAAGLPTCPLATLPPQAADTVRLVHSNGPFPYPRNDGEVFGNYEHRLPEQRRGYYHEYTVITRGSSDRSQRRIVTGGTPLTDPSQYFYTGDHYSSFCVVPDAGTR